MKSFSVSFLAYSRPATIAAPPEPPVRMPSIVASFRVITKQSRSGVTITSSMIFRSMVPGKKSSPMPSTT